MLREYVTTLPAAVGLVTWPRELGRATVIVKMRLTPNVHADLTPVDAREVETLALDETDGAGSLSYASDFAPYKTSCDFFVAGRDALDRAGGGHVATGTVERRSQPGETLGPQPTFCPGGDPSDPAALRIWSSGRIDFGVFQSAPYPQRLPFPRPPFAVRYMRSGGRFFARFVGPEPRVRLVDATYGEAHVATVLDTIAIRPERNDVVLVFRGVAAPRTWAEIVAVDRGEGVDLLRAPRFPLVETSMLRHAGAESPAEPVSHRPHRETRRLTTADIGGASALPFQATASSRQEPGQSVSPRQFAELREGSPHVPEASDALGQTMAANVADVWANRRPPPLPGPVIPPPQPLSAVPAPVKPAPLGAVERAPQKASADESENADAKLAAIQKEVWKGERPLAEILASHGMTELEWRAAKRARQGGR